MTNNIEILDLSSSAIIERRYREIFFKSAYKARNIFNECVFNYASKNKNILDLFYHEPFARNTYSSPCFFYLTSFLFLDQFFSCCQINHSNQNYLIIVDSPAQKKIISNLVLKYSINARIKYKSRGIIYFNMVKNNLLNPIRAIFFRILQFFLFKLTSRKKRILNILYKKKIILVDVFLTPKNIDERRWYGKFLTYLSSAQKDLIYFVPTLTLFDNFSFFVNLKKIRNRKVNQIIKDDFLNLSDFFLSLKKIINFKFLKLQKLNYLNVDITPIFQESFSTTTDFYTLLECYLTNRFFLRINQSKILVSTTCDWFEGQSLDKAWNISINKYYPHAIRLGYRSIINVPLCLCSIPTSLEMKLSLLPDTFLVPGKFVQPIITEFDPNLRTVVIPSLRYEYLYDNYEQTKKINTSKDFNILVTLPFSKVTAKSMINTLIEVSQSLLEYPNIVISLRKHPGGSYDLKKYLNGANHKLNISKFSTIQECYEYTDILITESSNTAIESIVLGIPTIILLANIKGLPDNPIPVNVSKDVYSIVETSEELLNTIIDYSKFSPEYIKILQEIGASYKEKFFLPVTSQGVQDMVKNIFMLDNC